MVRVAFANTYFLPPISHLDPQRPLFSDFRDIRLTDKDALIEARLSALTHEARVTFIRRQMYFQYRLRFSYEDVRGWEAARIAADPAYTGPRPDWAAPEG